MALIEYVPPLGFSQLPNQKPVFGVPRSMWGSSPAYPFHLSRQLRYPVSQRFLDSQAGHRPIVLNSKLEPDDEEHPQPWLDHQWITREYPELFPLVYQPAKNPRPEVSEPWHLSLRSCNHCEKPSLRAHAPEPAAILPQLIWETAPSYTRRSIPRGPYTYTLDVCLDDVALDRLSRYQHEYSLTSLKPFRRLCPPCHHGAYNRMIPGLCDSALQVDEKATGAPTKWSPRCDLLHNSSSEDSFHTCLPRRSDSVAQSMPTSNPKEFVRACTHCSFISSCDHRLAISKGLPGGQLSKAFLKPRLLEPPLLGAPCARCWGQLGRACAHPKTVPYPPKAMSRYNWKEMGSRPRNGGMCRLVSLGYSGRRVSGRTQKGASF